MPLDAPGWLGSLPALALRGVGRLSQVLAVEVEACRQVLAVAWVEPGWLACQEPPDGALLLHALGPPDGAHCLDRAWKRFEGAGCVPHPADSAKQVVALVWLVQVVLVPVWRPPMRSRALVAVLWACWWAPGGSPRFEPVVVCPSPGGEPGLVSLGRWVAVLGTGCEPEQRGLHCVRPQQVALEPSWQQDGPEVPSQARWALQAWMEPKVCLPLV